MEQSLSDLLSDAFSGTCVPSFPDEDLDFDKLDFDEMFEEDKTDISHENIPTEEDKSLHQEAMGETAVLSRMETKDMHKVENTDPEQYDEENDEEDFQGVDVGLASMDRTPEEDYTSSDGDSEQEDSVSGEDEEDEEEDTDTGVKPGDLLMSACSSYEFCCDNKEDRIFAEGQPPAPEGDENPQVRNEEQGEGESNEEVSYFGRVPECGNEMMIKGDVTEEDEQEGDEEKREDSSDSECEGMKVEQEENVAQRFEQDVENPYRCAPAADTLEFQERSVQNLQDLIVEADSEEDAEEVKDFSGEEHQEAGESFADYPSDFSSCEYVEDRVKHPECNFQSNALPHTSDSGSDAQQNICLEGAVTDITWMRSEEGTEEEGDEYLYSRDLEMEAEKFRSFDLAAGEKYRGKTEAVENVLGNAAVTGCVDVESDSYSSSDDEAQVRKRDEELVDSMCLDPENDKKLEDTWLYSTSSSAFSMWSISDDQPITNNRENPPDLSTNWDFEVSKTAFALCGDLSTTEDIQTETPLSSVSQRPAESNNSYSVVQRDDHKTTSPSYQGSLDDSFFFNTELEASGITELGQLGDDEYEDERNWEQEQERIKAFYEFYDSEGENEREERQIKVQFCTDPLSQVIHYETDSSDRDSLSSSTDRDEDLSSTETSEELREPDDNTLQMIPACDPPNTQLPESVPENDVSNTQICTRKHKCLGMLKLMLKMGLVIGVGLLTFWLATDQPDWFSQASFFQG